VLALQLADQILRRAHDLFGFLQLDLELGSLRGRLLKWELSVNGGELFDDLLAQNSLFFWEGLNFFLRGK